jgi:hypothetical protein
MPQAGIINSSNSDDLIKERYMDRSVEGMKEVRNP